MAAWIAELRYEELPPQVVAKGKQLLLDTIGCALGALEAVPVRLGRQVVREQGGNPQATPLGLSWKTSCEQAAFLNGMALRYLDFNDYAAAGRPHHPSINVASPLALAEAQGLSGKELLLGIVLGYEVQLRVREATAAGKSEGWDQSTTAHYSTAAAAARLLGLGPSAIAHAMAIAGSHASTLAEVRRGKLSMWKGAAEAMGVKNGTFAALLARAGITGPLTIFEGKHGFGKIVAGALEPEVLRCRSGDFQILKSCIKLWPCVATAQAPIAAALAIRKRGVKPESIKRICIFHSDFGYEQQKAFLEAGISTRESADHSVPYCVARAFLDGELRLDHFEEQAFRDARALDLMKKVSLQRDAGLTTLYPEILGAHVEVELQDATVLREEIPYPAGHPLNPASEGEVLGKFLSLSEGVLGHNRALQVAEMSLGIDQACDLSALVNALTVAGSKD
jgi:2-methylcitrate dehydratase